MPEGRFMTLGRFKVKATLEKLEENKATLAIEVDASTVEKALDHAYRRVVGRVSIPGFRKGKAPRRVVERFVGKDALWNEALDHLVGHAFDQAVASVGLDPIDRPLIEIVRMEEGEPLAFKAVVDVKPEVELGDYRSVSVPREAVEVTAADVDEQLRRLQERHAQLVPIEDGEVAAGTVVGFTVQTGVEVAIGEPQWAEIGAGTLREDFEQQIMGARPGEERSVQITFPADDSNEQLAGRTMSALVKIEEIKKKELPALDDAFAQAVAKCSSLEELRSQVENTLREATERAADRLQVNRAVAAVVEQARVDLPEVLVERRLESLTNQWREELNRYGLAPETYAERTGRTLEDVQAGLRGQAEAEVKAELVLEAVAKREGIVPTEAEVRKRLLATSMPESAAGIMRRALTREKAAAFLKDLAAANAAANAAAGSPAAVEA